MADREQRNGRMLFTDFDASDKGRPVAVFDDGAAQAVLDLPPPNLPSLDDIAASLGFAFEDDGDDTQPPPPPPQSKEKQPAGKQPSAIPEPPDGDSELVLDETENLKKKTGIHAPPSATDAPSWDALISAYARARPVAEEALSEDSHFAAFAPVTQTQAPAPEQDDAVDVLAMLDEEEPFPEARHIPYGGIERVDDWFAPPEDQPEPVTRVENWYEPPEAGTGPGNVDISWLSDFQNELPEAEYWHRKTTRIVKRDAPAAVSDADADAAGNAEPDAAVPQFVPPSDPAENDGGRPAAADTAALFSGMDFDRIWERKVAASQQPEPAAAPASDTRRISLFDNIDIDSLWDEKQDAKSGGADATTIVPQEVLAADRPRADTTVKRLPDPEAPDVLDELNGITADSLPRRAAPAKNVPVKDAPHARAPSAAPDVSFDESDMSDADETGEADDAFDVDELVEEAAGMDFDGTLIDGDRLDHDDADGEEREYVARTPPAESSRKKGLSADDLLDGIDIDSLAGESGDVSAPVIDDSAIDAIPKATRSGTAEMRAVAEGETGGTKEEPAAVAVNPMDVFADMDNMDFSDDVDDDMRAMLEDEETEGAEEDGAAADAQAGTAAAKEATDVIPATRLGRAWRGASKAVRRYLPMQYVDKALGMVAWRENWWFYCDLVAAVVASASLAVIISYFFWYRGV